MGVEVAVGADLTGWSDTAVAAEDAHPARRRAKRGRIQTDLFVVILLVQSRERVVVGNVARPGRGCSGGAPYMACQSVAYRLEE